MKNFIPAFFISNLWYKEIVKKKVINNKNKKLAGGERSRTIFVGVSGGVDSSVSLTLLKKEGYEVVGVFIKTWHPDFIECNEEEEKRDAMRVCAHLDVPFLELDLEKEYKEGVADYMIAEYKKGRTPNPDVFCNSEVKFGAFMDWAIKKGADFVATGHYAQNIKNNLIKGKDLTKDQVYFLWKLKKEQLEKILFPIGHLKKSQVRVLAKKFKLPVSSKPDSQGICFLGDIDLKEFLKHYIKSKKGIVKNEKDEEIGEHDGVEFITLGARHGFTITKRTPNDKPYYVVDKDVEKNILYVSQDKKNSKLNNKKEIELIDTNWISESLEINKNYTAQIRYHGEFLNCKLSKMSFDTKQMTVIFEKPVLVAGGQSVVIYDKNIVLGGGIVA